MALIDETPKAIRPLYWSLGATSAIAPLVVGATIWLSVATQRPAGQAVHARATRHPGPGLKEFGMTEEVEHRDPDPAQFLTGGGEMGALMRRRDWSETSFGPPVNWPQSLRSAVSIMLNSRYPIALYWGPELALLYNDAWSPLPGGKHPWALGRPGREVWPGIWVRHPEHADRSDRRRRPAP